MARGVLLLSSLVLVGSVWMALVNPRGSGEFVISVISIVLGLIGMGGSLLMARWNLHRPVFKEEQP